MKTDEARWTEIEHLPEWDEEYYDVYTAKKLGKWVMLKTLKHQFKDDPEMQLMLEHEFDVRYNLCHPNIILVTDYEDVPGVGRSIIFDDVYGDSLAKLLDEGKVTPEHVEKLKTQLVSAMEYIQYNHLEHQPLSTKNIIFTENVGNLKLIDVGFNQRKSLSHQDTTDDVQNYGFVIQEVLRRTGIQDSHLAKVAARCADEKINYGNAHRLRVALANRSTNRLYLLIIAFLVVMVAVLIILSICPPTPLNQ